MTCVRALPEEVCPATERAVPTGIAEPGDIALLRGRKPSLVGAVAVHALYRW